MSSSQLESILLVIQNHLSLFFFAAILASIATAASITYTKRSEDDSPIPLYIPETTAAGNKKKRWLYDGVNTLQEAYKKVNLNM